MSPLASLESLNGGLRCGELPATQISTVLRSVEDVNGGN